jgi:DMSO/TMAO reductase YedYZ molybdopterin-dependent catalytic subunit/thiosulfate reductase cytochrome b subunit
MPHHSETRATMATPSEPDVHSPEVVSGLRERLTEGEDIVDPKSWAGSIPAAFGIAPRLRIGAKRWFNLVALIPIGWALLLAAVMIAQYLRELPEVEAFISRHPGTGFAAPFATALPVWLRAQHFLNLFLLVFIIRAGLQILADHPRLYWTRHSTPGKEWLRMQKEVPDTPLWTAKQDSLTLPKHLGLPGLRHSIGLARWWHLGADTLWLANGLVFYVLLFASGEWRRIVPTSWQVLPDAASVLLQYLSLRWPVDDSWAAYNGLQMIAYFITVFIAAPLALVTGLGMSPALSTKFHGISKRLSIQTARSMHFLVLCWFLVFTLIHVTLVFATGALRNLNHIYSGTNATDWIGFGIFAASMAIVAVAWVAATPFTLRHPRVVQRVGYALIGPAQRLFEHLDAKPGAYSEKDVSPYFWHNGKYPETPEYRALFDGHFADWRLQIRGLVENPMELSLADLRALPRHEQITQHFCIQGWSGIAKWGGVSMQTILDIVKPEPEAKWVVFYSLGDGADGGRYYDAHPIEQMRYRLTMLAYDMNGESLSYGHGAPLRLRNEVQLGFKQVKWLAGIEFVAAISEVGGGYGGYNEDHEFFGYRQSL